MEEDENSNLGKNMSPDFIKLMPEEQQLSVYSSYYSDKIDWTIKLQQE
jgi:hypothetical protein